MKEQIQQIHPASRKTSGTPIPTATLRERIHAALQQRGFGVGRHQVARLMKQAGIGVRHADQAALQDGKSTCRMSRKGNRWDNAVAESCFGRLKTG